MLAIYVCAKGVAAVLVRPVELREMHACIQYDDLETLARMLEGGAEPDGVRWRDSVSYKSLLQRAFDDRKWAAATMLLAHGADPNEEFVYTRKAVCSVRPLHEAAWRWMRRTSLDGRR